MLLQLLLFAPRLNSDGAYYYEFLRSWVVQNDLNFDDEREFYTWEWVPVFRDFLPGDWEDTGYPPNIFSFGPAVVWLPFYVTGHLILMLLHAAGAPISLSGYGILHRFLPMAISMVSGWFTLVLCDCLGRDSGFDEKSRSGALMVYLGASHLPAFLFVTPAFSHAFSVLFTTVFVVAWYRTGRLREGPAPVLRYALFGMIGGMAVISRWQNLFCMLLPLTDAVMDFIGCRTVKRFRDILVRWLSFATGLCVIVMPQLLVTKTLYGRWLTDPQGEGGMHWFHLNLRLILFDRIKGLFTVNPILLPAVVALPFLWRKNRRMAWGLLLLTLSQTYINAVRRDWAGVGFGMRRFLNLTPAFAIGLMVVFALVYRTRQSWIRRLTWIFAGILIGWNLLLMAQYYLSPLGAPWIEMTFGQLVERQFTMSPELLSQLVASGLTGRAVTGDIPSLCLAVIGILLTGVCFRLTGRWRNRTDCAAGIRAGRLLTAWGIGWCLMLGWLGIAIAGTERFDAVTLVPGPRFGELRPLTLNPKSGYLGYAAGIRFGPGPRWTVLESRAEYDRNRFLDPGSMTCVPTVPMISGTRIQWSFPDPVPADRLILISGFDDARIPDPDSDVAVITAWSSAGEAFRFPVISARHTGCSAEQPPVMGDLLPRNWPALRPIQRDEYDTRTVYPLPGPRFIRSLSIEVTVPQPVIWRIRGVAFHRVDPGPVIGVSRHE